MIKHFSNFNGMDRHHIFEAQVDKKYEGIDNQITVFLVKAYIILRQDFTVVVVNINDWEIYDNSSLQTIKSYGVSDGFQAPKIKYNSPMKPKLV